MDPQWPVDLTGDGATVASELAAALPAAYCASTGFCALHLHFMAEATPVGAVVVSFPRDAVDGPDLAELQLAPVYTAAVTHPKARTHQHTRACGRHRD
jgi:hypothetical protein